MKKRKAELKGDRVTVNKRWKKIISRILICTAVFTGGLGSVSCSQAQASVIASEIKVEYSGPASDLPKASVKGSASGPGVVELAEASENIEEGYLGGAELRLLTCADGGQNLSCVIRTAAGSVIVVDGGREVDKAHLTEVIQSMGGRVSAWLLTHPHNDHVGALTEILNDASNPVEIDKIYYSFLENNYYEQGEHQGRMSDLTNLQAAFQNMDPAKLYAPVKKGDQILVDDVLITVMNDPYACPQNTFNNSSVGYRLEVGGKRILFLGDMGWQAGENLLKVCSANELKADVVQMSHHGQAGVEREVYEVISPEICLWPTPQWLWDNEKSGVAGAGSYKTLEVRGWMKALGAERHLTIKDGDRILR